MSRDICSCKKHDCGVIPGFISERLIIPDGLRITHTTFKKQPRCPVENRSRLRQNLEITFYQQGRFALPAANLISKASKSGKHINSTTGVYELRKSLKNIFKDPYESIDIFIDPYEYINMQVR